MENVKSVSKATLKAHMLEYFREVERSGVELIVTDHRKPVLKIVSLDRKFATAESVFAKYQNQVKYYEALSAPTSEEWGDLS